MDIEKKPELKAEPVHPHSTTHKIWLGSYFFLALACVALYFLLQWDVFHVLGKYQLWLKKSSLAAAVAFIILLVAKYLEGIVARRSHSKAARYNLVRLIRLISALVVVFVFVSFLFQHWYAAAVSLGLFSLILGFALQTPISSFIGWLYIILRNPYRVGDRIQVNDFKGDVVEIGYLDTTLWEFGGDYMTSDLPTGRLVLFPNSLLFSYPVFNYSWRKFPYIWNEIPFHIAYESDFDYVSATMKTVAKAALGEAIAEHVEELREMIKETAIDEMEIKEYPFVTFRTNANTWVEATLIYLVHPRQASVMRSNIMRQAIAELLKQPDKVMFPNGNGR